MYPLGLERASKIRRSLDDLRGPKTALGWSTLNWRLRRLRLHQGTLEANVKDGKGTTKVAAFFKPWV